MKRVLVTGSAGFVGANLARRLLGDGHNVHLLLSRPAVSWRLRELDGEFQHHVADLRDPSAVQRVVQEARPDWIFHLAAFGAYSWQTDVRTIYDTNVFGTLNLLEACQRSGFEVFVNTGSSSEYGCQPHAPSEDELPRPNSAYAAAKVAATMYCQHTARATRLRIPTLRLYSIYGPYEDPNRLLPGLLVHGLDGRCPPLVNPAIARDFVYVDDAVDAYLLAATVTTTEPDMVVNVGSGRQTRLDELVEETSRLFPGRQAPVWGSMPPRSWDTTVWVADARKIHKELGWTPRHDLAGGLRAFTNWLNEHPEWLQYYCAEMKSRAAA